MLLAGVALKFVPVMVTLVPMGPEVGAKLVMVGVTGTDTTKLVVLVPIWQLTWTLIGPVVAPPGTVVVMLVAVLAVTVAATPLNLTMLFPGTGSKLVPVMVIVLPVGADNGVKFEMLINAMVLSSKETAFPLLAERISGLPSKLTSVIATSIGRLKVDPASKLVALEKLPNPSPRQMETLVIGEPSPLAVTISGLPSEFMSATATLNGPRPTLTFVVPEKPPVPSPNLTDTVLLDLLAVSKSGIPSRLTSAKFKL